MTLEKSYSKAQTFFLVFLRLFIGWHFLYEGIVKLSIPGWSAAEYLQVSSWIFAGFFHWIAETPVVLAVVNVLNMWGLVLIGLALILGVFTRLASFAGMALLALYYVANPPFVGLEFGVPTEGHYLVVNKNLIELFAMGILAVFPTSPVWGFDQYVKKIFARKTEKPTPEKEFGKPAADDVNRRSLIKGLVSVPALAAFGMALAKKYEWKSWEEKNLVDAETSATTKMFDAGKLADLKGEIPKATIAGVDYSRIILGGNLLSGYSHSRDLTYVSSLVKAYHNKDKIFATLLMAEKCGVNTLLTNPILATVIDEYWKRNIGKIQFISDCAGLDYTNGPKAIPFQEYKDRVQRAMDYGAIACYIQGETADHYMQNGRVDELAKIIQLVRDNNVSVGIGAHHINTVKQCVDAGFDPDFWMKTLHHHNYWSAGHETWHDNKYCFDPAETIAYMKELPQPWIAFKVMAAGAIHPKNAFQYAFENGADLICAGMYDFQMVEDINIAHDILSGDIKRERPWCA